MLDRFREVEARMSAATDGAEIVRLSKEHAELKPVADAVLGLETARAAIPDLQEMIESGDRELAEMARADLEAINEQLPGLEPTARVNATTHLLHALKAGLGVAPYGCIVADLEPDLIRCLPIPPPRPAVWMVTRAELKDAPRVRAFTDFFLPFIEQTRRALVERGQAMQDRKMAELEAALAAAG